MQRRELTLLTAALLSCSATAAAQDGPRTPWGHPDFRGTWTNATLTPLQRPVELGDKEFYTPEEREAFAQARRAATTADRPLAPGEVGSYGDVFFERGTSGVKTGRTSLVIEPRNGRIPVLTPVAQQAVERRTAHMAAHPADRPSDRWLTERCILFGATVPMLPEPYNNNYQIFQTPEHIVVLVEMNHDARIIPLDDAGPLSSAIAQWTGDSRGHFEGDTLIVETRNFKFNEQSRFGVGYLNGVSDENLRVVERFARLGRDTIMYRATIEDPTVFASPWTVEIPFTPSSGPLFEVACHEGNLGLANILSGHRAEERAAAGRTSQGESR
jgi:hypothetical protein